MNKPWPLAGNRLKLMMFDFNWSFLDPNKDDYLNPSSPADWAFVDPKEYFDWHLAVGNNAVFLQAYTSVGYAFYDTRLGPPAPGSGREFFPRLFELARRAGLPVYSYFCSSFDCVLHQTRQQWLVPDEHKTFWNYRLAPESPWTDLLCARVEEFLGRFPVDVLFLDWFNYGNHKDPHPVKPAWFVERPFREIIGRPMPGKAEEIRPEESLRYRREVLARQFFRLRDVAKRVSPSTKLIFTPPYQAPGEPLWVDHPMVKESDGLLAEYSKPETMEWLLSIRRPDQAVIATPMGPADMTVRSIRDLYARGCGMCGYLWGVPPRLQPHPRFEKQLKIVSEAFRQLH